MVSSLCTQMMNSITGWDTHSTERAQQPLIMIRYILIGRKWISTVTKTECTLTMPVNSEGPTGIRAMQRAQESVSVIPLVRLGKSSPIALSPSATVLLKHSPSRSSLRSARKKSSCWKMTTRWRKTSRVPWREQTWHCSRQWSRWNPIITSTIFTETAT